MWLVTLLTDALSPVLDFLLEQPYGTQYANQTEEYKRWKSGELLKDESSTQVRMDWELSDEAFKEVDSNVKQLMINQIKFDLEDLIENGDRHNAADALLKAIDGSKKRGQEPVEIQILGAILYKEVKKKQYRDTTGISHEYTLFLRPYIRWE